MIAERTGEMMRRRSATQRLGASGAESTPMLPPARYAWVQPGWIALIASITLALMGIASIALTTDGSIALRQSVFLTIGLIAAAVAMVPHYRTYSHYAWPMAIVAVALLVFVMLPFVPEAIVRPRKGARRWINVGVTEFQPSELAKVAMVFVLAQFLRFRASHRSLLGLIKPALIAGVPMMLVLIEPDLGTSLLFMPTLVIMLIAAGAKLWHILGTCALGGGFAAFIVLASLAFAQQDQYPLLRPHQVSRILAVMDLYTGDERFLDDRAYQGRQAMKIAGAGGATGHPAERTRALVRFNPLPEKHNDMIFPVIVNRWGIAGGLGVLSLYTLWVASTLAVGWVCKDPFGRLVCVGFAGMVATQAAVNMGMTLGLLPITGMTLPFISYGGSSLLMGFVMVGVVCGIGLRRPAYFWRESFDFSSSN